jgi:S1-C subfamily serine protease
VEVQTVPLLRRIVRFYDLPKETGVIVLAAENASPAHKAALHEGDVIIAFNKQPVAGVDDLHRLLTDTQVNVPSSITILRRTGKLDLEITPHESRE